MHHSHPSLLCTESFDFRDENKSSGYDYGAKRDSPRRVDLLGRDWQFVSPLAALLID